jgi:hypothetical protein
VCVLWGGEDEICVMFYRRWGWLGLIGVGCVCVCVCVCGRERLPCCRCLFVQSEHCTATYKVVAQPKVYTCVTPIPLSEPQPHQPQTTSTHSRQPTQKPKKNKHPSTLFLSRLEHDLQLRVRPRAPRRHADQPVLLRAWGLYVMGCVRVLGERGGAVRVGR